MELIWIKKRQKNKNLKKKKNVKVAVNAVAAAVKKAKKRKKRQNKYLFLTFWPIRAIIIGSKLKKEGIVLRKIFLVVLFWGLAGFMFLAKWPVRQIVEAIGCRDHPDVTVLLLAAQYLVIVCLMVAGASILSRYPFGRIPFER